MQIASKAIHILPFSQVDISKFQKVFIPDEAKISKQLGQTVNKYVTWSEKAPIAAGDVAVCRLESQLTKFDRASVTLSVGSGLFDKELEAALLGRQSGESFAFSKDGEAVTVQILSVKNKNVPALTDVMVAGLGIDGVQTIEGYRSYLIARQKEEQFEEESYEVVAYIIGQVLTNSDLLIKQDDWQRYVNFELHKIRTYALDEGKEIEKLQGDEWEGLVPVRSFFECVALLQNNAWEHMSMVLLGQELAKTTGFTVTAEMYERYIRDMMAGWGGQEKVYREAVPFEYFELFSYTGHYYRELDKYLKANLYLEEA